MRRGPAFLLAFLLSAPLCSLAQSTWSQHYGGTAEDYASAVVQTADSGYAFFGRTASYGAGNRDCWLVRTDAEGAMLWNRAYGGAANDYGYALAQTADHGFVLAGSSYTAGGNANAWVARTDSVGDTLWTRTLGGAAEEQCYALTLAADGGIVCAGFSRSYSNGGEDFWLFKLSATGDSLWSRHFGGAGMDEAWAIAPAPDGGFLLAGQTQSYGPGIGSWPNFWLVRTSAQGDSLWSRVYGGTQGDWAYAATPLPGGGFLVGGNTSSYGAGGADGWLLRLNASGDSLWGRTFGGTGSERGNAVIADSAGGCLLAGNRGSNFWLVKADSSGNFLWERTLGGASTEDCHAALATIDNAYVLAGGTYSYTHGGQDAWLVKTRAALPEIATTPGHLAFRDTEVAATHTDTVFIHNASDVNFTLSGVSVPAPFQTDFTGTQILGPGDTRRVTVIFAPNSLGEYNGLLTVHSSAVQGDSLVTLFGRCVVDAPVDTFNAVGTTPATLLYGSVVVGHDSTRSVCITNIGQNNLMVWGVGVPSGFHAAFGSARALAPQDTLHVAVTFAPDTARVYGGNFTVHSSAQLGDSLVALSGTGLLPADTLRTIDVFPDTLSLGAIPLHQDGQAQAIVRNTGTVPLAIYGCEAPPPFFASYNGLDVLAPGAQDTLWITLIPQSAGNYSATVRVHSNADRGDSTLYAYGLCMEAAAEDPRPLPTAFALTAHPNPFNPATTLAFDLPHAARVRLAVYDVTGRLVRVLADALHAAGHYRVAVDGSDLPSGVYIARLDGGPVVLTHKLVLLK